MTRLIATASDLPGLRTGARAVIKGLSRVFAADRNVPGLDELDREHMRIRLQSRHWLM